MDLLLPLALAGIAAVFLWRTFVETRHASIARSGLLGDAAGLLQDPVHSPLPSGFTKLTGIYRGQHVALEPVIDTLNVRKLPVLWLLVTVADDLPIAGTFNLMMRATGLEVFSRYHQLPHSVDVPQGFPEWAGLRTDNPNTLPPPELVSPYLQRFHDGTGKELLISPKGVRMVVMINQADRGGYLIFRDARFDTATIGRDTVKDVLDDLLALRSDILAHAEERRVVRS